MSGILILMNIFLQISYTELQLGLLQKLYKKPVKTIELSEENITIYFSILLYNVLLLDRFAEPKIGRVGIIC